ncbi:AAA family ATPase [Octadecabacter sp. SW4]|jgi:predicted ATP-dependent endonuclease of OLD family|uniref:AAA family ATPase n=1 Tax=Octadecabacter sp. SW4 TaxID=2602067 RepID=UPI00155A5550|nr:AAA family ATPase [Octadecabacter sp. SW4]
MKLKTVRIDHFKHVLDSTEVAIQPDITCLVGKNESGKSAFLEALRRLKPAHGAASFSSPTHYPAWLEKRHRREAKAKGRDLDEKSPINATFTIEPEDVAAVEARFGEDVLLSDTFTISRKYTNQYAGVFEVDETKAVANLLADIELPTVLEPLNSCEKFSTLRAKVSSLSPDGSEESATTLALTEVTKAINELLPDDTTLWQSVWRVLFARVPQFFYFSEYSSLPSTVPIRELLEADEDKLEDDEQTALALLQLAEFEKDHLLDADYETRKRELQNVANELGEQVLDYWTTNQHLRVEMDLTLTKQPANNGQTTVIDELHIRMWDDQHKLSLRFDERSSGFRWFFSFLTAFSRYEFDDTPIIILLDEPGLGLHATAQRDFLRFIEERLSKRCQVIYTTHSPFMIQPDHLERARLVEDKGRDRGSVTTSDVLTTDSDTLFPLQAALGYDIAQHLFIAKDNLVVEGPSDFLFMQTISERLIEDGREGLDKRWSIMPLGGADVIPAFVALLGNHLDVTVVVDSRKEGHQKLTALAKAGFLGEKRIITIGEVADRKMADIEDLFAKDDYVALYNAAFGKKMKAVDLKGTDPIVRQIARNEGVDRYDHNAPAEVLLRERAKRVATLSDETLNAFEALFKRINETLA